MTTVNPDRDPVTTTDRGANPSVFTTPGAAATGLAAVIYGAGVAFGDSLWGEKVAWWWLMGGAAVMAILFVAFIVWPWLQRRDGR